MPRALTFTALAAVLFTGTGCVRVYSQQPDGAPAPARAAQSESDDKAEEPKSPFKKWTEVLKDTEALPGYLTFHRKRDNTVYLELKPDQLGREFGLIMHYSRGVGDFDLHDGLPLSDTRLMRFDRVGDKVYLTHVNTRFTADEGSPMRNSLDDNVGHSRVRAFDIQSEHESEKHLLLDVTPLFVSDYPQIASLIKPYYGNKSVGLDKDRSHVGSVMNFPRNSEIDVELTFETSDRARVGGEGVSDERSIPVGVRYSLFALPETPMARRLADDRVGNFLDAVRDFSRDLEESSYVRYVQRWRLEKQDHTAETSEPVTPIVYYVDRSVPIEYRRYVKEGIEAWNKAFAAAGFRNAIVARDAPDDSTWSAEDIRYSTVRWTAAHRMGYAIGPSQTDPRTGEILNADVLISSTWVRSWLTEYQNLSGPEAMRRGVLGAEEWARGLPPHLAQRLCLAEVGKRHQLAVQYALLVGLGALDGGMAMPEEYLGDAIRDLIMHEVGHTLGMRHNFKGSAGIDFRRLHDTTYTREHGVTLSVMDYGAVNVAADQRRQGHFWNKEVGTYDVWAIQYAYAPIYQQKPDGPLAMSGALAASPDAELVGLRKIADRSAEPLHVYGTDEDNWLGAFAVDPRTSAWELGSDPVEFAKSRLEVVDRVGPNLERRLIADGEGYQRLRAATTALFFERYLALVPSTKVVGGLYVSRDHKGTANGSPPFAPVPAAKQREAVRVIAAGAFAEDAFSFDPATINKLAPSRWYDWSAPGFPVPIEFPVHGWVASIQLMLLGDLMDPFRVARVIDNRVRTPAGADYYSADELFDDLTTAIWTEILGTPRNVHSFRRNLQRAHLVELSRFLLDDSGASPEDARSLARYELTRLGQRIDAVLGSEALDAMTRAHLSESRARIDRVLETSLTRVIE